MTILLSPSFYLPMKTGVTVFTQQLAETLVRKGHQVVIVTPKLEPAQPSFEMIDGIEVHRMSFAFPWRMLWQRPQEDLLQFFLRWPLDLQRLVRLLVQKHVEVINIQSTSGPHLPYLLVAQVFAHRPLVLTLHGSEFLRLNARGNGMRRWLQRYALRKAEQVTTVSSHLASEAGRFCPEASGKIVTIPTGVALDEFDGPVRFPFPSSYLLSLARLNPLKGHDVLLSAFRMVAEREKNIHLIIAGDGPQRIRLHAIALAFGLKDRVTLLGEVGRERVKELLAGCEFLVHHSWSEGIPFAVLEAMASGKAVVGTRVGGIPEVVSDLETGRLVPPGDSESLAKAMLFLLHDGDQCKAMGEQGRAFVMAHHSDAQTVDRYLDVYRKALHQPSEGRTGQKERS